MSTNRYEEYGKIRKGCLKKNALTNHVKAFTNLFKQIKDHQEDLQLFGILSFSVLTSPQKSHKNAHFPR